MIADSSNKNRLYTTSRSHSSPSVVNQLDASERRWFVVITGYRKEKAAAHELAEKQIEVYLPILHRTRVYDSKRKEVALPLINRYVFVHIKQSEYVPVLSAAYVQGFLKFGRDLIAVPDEEIALLRRVTGEKRLEWDTVNTHETALPPGTPVQVIAGELTGLQGKLVEQVNGKLFVIELETLGIQLQVDGSLLEFRKPPRPE
jgi:transcription antitermination factor NusG